MSLGFPMDFSMDCPTFQVLAAQLRLRQDPHTAWPKCRGPGSIWLGFSPVISWVSYENTGVLTCFYPPVDWKSMEINY